MRYNLLRIIFILLLITLATDITTIHAEAIAIEKLRERVIKDALYEKGFLPRVSRYIVPDFDKASDYLAEMNADGSWENVDYQDKDNNWAPLKALDKILVMTHAYSHPDNPHYSDKKLLDGITRALGYWYQIKPTCVNWYKNEIAKQMYLGVIALLLQNEIEDDLLQNMIKDQTDEPRMTGSNKTLLSISVFYRGLLEKNPERITAGVQGVMTQVEVSEKEGIQIDNSFHQHGPYLYNGNYGSDFLRETIWLAAMVEGSEFAFSEARVKVLRDYYFEGTRWMIRGILMDYNIRGRQVGRPEGGNLRGEVLLPQLNYFIQADPENIDAYKFSRNLILRNQPQDILGNKHFWRSDYTVHHRRDYFTSLRMCSARTVGVETHVNFENMLGRNIPYGLTYIYRRGNEYEQIFPVWDWAKLPGVTCSYEVPSEKGHYSQEVDFVGGVSDGLYGISVMELDLRETKAKKSWFWFDKEWVALGAGIKSENDNTINTGINQTLLKGKIIMDGKVFTNENDVLEKPKWIWHDSIAYLFPSNPKNVHLESKVKSGNMKLIYGLGSDSTLTKDVFNLWFDHGVKPENESYEYIVVPGITEVELIRYVKNNPIKILSNTSEIQAVASETAGLTGIVFHKSGVFELNDKLSIEVNHPCLVLINHTKQQISVSDPTAKLTEMVLKIITNKGKNEFVTVNFPQGLNAGQSVKIGSIFDKVRINNSNR
ncbi:MAG: polysaccharide lyase beta-sandwich domain-containing protein [Cyclobacteriaceae bacterium]|jgi:chondroitin AC lyase|nr:polysaccharide lyase beta-sandwich domain-containing protein [Cyclobacteriaceae bacterium]